MKEKGRLSVAATWCLGNNGKKDKQVLLEFEVSHCVVWMFDTVLYEIIKYGQESIQQNDGIRKLI